MRFRVRIEFVPADCWIGVYFKRERLARIGSPTLYTAFVCLIPCFPIIVQVQV